jgi:menaquinone-9 beta-reductase
MRTGADKALGEKLESLERDEGGLWSVNGRYRSPLVVGAGGHFCPVAARLGMGPGKHERAITAKEVEFEMNSEQAAACEVREDTPELWFCRDLKGYAWVFRKADYLNIGLGREGNYRLKEHLQAFVDEMQAAGRLPPDLPGRFKGHAYLLYGRAERPLIDDGLLLIGDAAGLAYDQSGEGIRPGIESALIAAQVITRVDDYSRAGLAEYAERINERFGPRADETGKPGIQLPAWAKLKAAPPLMRSHWFTRRVVTERWFLHQQVPPLQAS